MNDLQQALCSLLHGGVTLEIIATFPKSQGRVLSSSGSRVLHQIKLMVFQTLQRLCAFRDGVKFPGHARGF
jgi:hypothetical protein